MMESLGQPDYGGIAAIFFGVLAGVAGLVTLATKGKSSDVQMPTTKQCPFCAERIKQEAKVCRFCGRELTDQHPV